ncbi:MAG: HAD-IB family phosphatase, partial [Pseudomonadota bacterium]
MTYTLTLVAPHPFHDTDVKPLLAGISAHSFTRLGPEAVELTSDQSLEALQGIAAKAQSKGIDANVMRSEGRRKRILISDMDSTIIEQECLDELAILAGCGDEIIAITERAMRGELNFEEALTARVAQLKGVPKEMIDEVISSLTLSPGAKTLVQTMAAHGAVTALVSGGFTPFTGHIAVKTGFSRHQGNSLEIDDDGVLTGGLTPPLLGPQAKKDTL